MFKNFKEKVENKSKELNEGKELDNNLEVKHFSKLKMIFAFLVLAAFISILFNNIGNESENIKEDKIAQESKSEKKSSKNNDKKSEKESKSDKEKIEAALQEDYGLTYHVKFADLPKPQTEVILLSTSKVFEEYDVLTEKDIELKLNSNGEVTSENNPFNQHLKKRANIVKNFKKNHEDEKIYSVDYEKNGNYFSIRTVIPTGFKDTMIRYTGSKYEEISEEDSNKELEIFQEKISEKIGIPMIVDYDMNGFSSKINFFAETIDQSIELRVKNESSGVYSVFITGTIENPEIDLSRSSSDFILLSTDLKVLKTNAEEKGYKIKDDSIRIVEKNKFFFNDQNGKQIQAIIKDNNAEFIEL